ncbi:MAG: HIT domain-containing protein [Candidatus Wolfebacteria bacterium]|nr:HIT domain-containing protein [Candidatus Wolfebacteria bacterium]
MLYGDFLKKSKQCPFCLPQERIIEKKFSFLTYALAPYHKDHLLVVPKRHTESFLDLRKKERDEMLDLVSLAVKILQSFGYKDCSILGRDGNNAGKSIKHFHFHIIPKVLLGDIDNYRKERKILSKQEIGKIIGKIKTVIKNKRL